MTIFFFALKRSFHEKFTLIALYAIPITLVFIRPLWVTNNKMGFSLYGMVIMVAAFLLVRAIMTDRITGTVNRIFVAPVTTFQYLSQNLLAYLLLLTVQILSVVVLGLYLYSWGFILSLKLFICYTIFAGSAIGFSLAWNSLFRNKETSDTIFGGVVSLMSIVGGAFVPLDRLPSIVQKIGMLFPTYWLSNALFLLEEGNHTGNYLLSIAAMLMFTLGYLILGSKRRLE